MSTKEEGRPAVLSGGVRQMANILEISERSAYRGVASGQLPGIKVGGRWLVPEVAFQRFLEGNWSSPTNSGESQHLN